MYSLIMEEETLVEYKGYMVVPERQGSMLVIKMKGQGPVPDPLRGVFTSRGEAHKAIDSYLDSLLKKGKSNGKAKSTSTT